MARHSPVELFTGAAVLAVAVGFIAYALVNTGKHVGASTYELNARFDHADGLTVGADVKIAGVPVGAVDAITLDPKTYLASVAFSVRDGVTLSTDSSATIASESLLGGKYLALTTGGDDATLKPGGSITITQGSLNIESLIGKYIFGGVGDKGGAPKDKPADQPAGGGIAPLK